MGQCLMGQDAKVYRYFYISIFRLIKKTFSSVECGKAGVAINLKIVGGIEAVSRKFIDTN